MAEKFSMPMVAMLYKWFLLSCFLSTAPARDQVNMHPFYVSVTEIEQNVADKTLEISCKVFAEDIEQALEKSSRLSFDISAEKDKATVTKLIPGYFSGRLNLSVDGKAVALKFIGFEKEKESVYCYFQVDNISSVKKLDATNTILYDFNESQINIMHVKIDGKEKSDKVSYPDKNLHFEW